VEHDLVNCPCDDCAQHRDDCRELDQYPVMGGKWWQRRKVKPPTSKPEPTIDDNKPDTWNDEK
jgi:hypothetical protein